MKPDKVIAQVKRWQEQNPTPWGLRVYQQEGADKLVLPCTKADGAIVDKEAMTISNHLITAREIDRQGDVMEPRGLQLKAFRANPVVLANHNPFLPVGVSLRQVKGEDGVRATTRFHNLTQEAEDWARLFLEGILKGWSIGFMALEVQDLEELKEEELAKLEGMAPRLGFRIVRSELVEYSAVTIPAVRGALTRELESGRVKSPVLQYALKGVDVEAPVWAPGIDLAELGDGVELREVALEIGEDLEAVVPALTTKNCGCHEGDSEEVQGPRVEGVQELQFEVELFGKQEAAVWAAQHGYEAGPVIEGAERWRILQVPAQKCQRSGYRYQELSEGVRAVIAQEVRGLLDLLAQNPELEPQRLEVTVDTLMSQQLKGEVELVQGCTYLLSDGVYRAKRHSSGSWQMEQFPWDGTIVVDAPRDVLEEVMEQPYARVPGAVYRCADGEFLYKDGWLQPKRPQVELTVKLEGVAQKAGKVLSRANMQRLTQAYELLGQVLGSAAPKPAEGEETEGKGAGVETPTQTVGISERAAEGSPARDFYAEVVAAQEEERERRLLEQKQGQEEMLTQLAVRVQNTVNGLSQQVGELRSDLRKARGKVD